MAENDTGSEREVRKEVVYSSKEGSRSWLPAAVIIGIIVLALLAVIFTRIDW